MCVCVCVCATEYDELDAETTRLGSQGFTGCLSVVQFNSIAPLKAALLYPHTSPVTVSGTLTDSNCGSSSSSSPYAAETTHSLSGIPEVHDTSNPSESQSSCSSSKLIPQTFNPEPELKEFDFDKRYFFLKRGKR